MAGGNCNVTVNCSAEALQQCSSQMICSGNVNITFHKSIGIRGQLWRVDALILVEAILASVIVGIGAYGQRYRHHPITRFLFLGATTLFLPIISSVASTVSVEHNYVIPFQDFVLGDELSALVATCRGTGHVIYFTILAYLVLVVMINTSTIVSLDDREGQSKGPPPELLIQGIWTFYLGVGLLKEDAFFHIFLTTPFVLLCSKIGLKFYAFEKARRSIAFGRNPGLVSVYMRQLQAQETVNQHIDEPMDGEGADAGALSPPPLLVMMESEQQIEKHPQGYAFKDDYSRITLNKNFGLVTIDRVWRLDGTLLTETPRLKDLCLSFALFKLLRCRFARCKLTNGGSTGTRNFFQSLLLHKVGEDDRMFGVITEELSFVHDYYYSSLPISYSKQFLPILSIFVSLLTIGYCTFITAVVISAIQDGVDHHSQLSCVIWCVKGYLVGNRSDKDLGIPFFDQVPLLLLLVLVVTVEVRDMASYICSSWTKVTLTCHYINRNSSAYSPCIQSFVSTLLRCRCRLMKNWDDKMSQCWLLVPHPKKTAKVLGNRVIRVLLPDHRRKVKVPAAVKVNIMNAVRRSLINGRLSNGAESLQRSSQVGESFLWACNGKGTSDIILTWHIATCILEVKHPYRSDYQEQGSPPNPSSADYKIAATHLSKYCAYLVSWCPELLPDKNNAWSKSLYKAVKKDTERVLAGDAVARSSNPEDEYQKLIHLLSANSKDELLKNGVKLGKQLSETIDGDEAAWKLLADFWSEMILYIAPSDNLKGHSEAIARGGELITLLWALLFHVGIVSRPGEEDSAAAASS